MLLVYQPSVDMLMLLVSRLMLGQYCWCFRLIRGVRLDAGRSLDMLIATGASTFSGYANVAGVSTFSGDANVCGFSTFLETLNTAGVSTFSNYANVSGIATYALDCRSFYLLWSFWNCYV
jgi:hypothetical protein